MGPGPLLNAKVVLDIRSGHCHGHLGSLSTRKAQLVPSGIRSQPLAMLAAIGTPFTSCKTLAIKQGEHCASDYFFLNQGSVWERVLVLATAFALDKYNLPGRLPDSVGPSRTGCLMTPII